MSHREVRAVDEEGEPVHLRVLVHQGAVDDRVVCLQDVALVVVARRRVQHA